MPKHTRQARIALATYRELVHLVHDMSPADRRSFERGLADIGEAVQYEDGPLREEVGLGHDDLLLDHFDGLDAMLTLCRLGMKDGHRGPSIEKLVDARQHVKR